MKKKIIDCFNNKMSFVVTTNICFFDDKLNYYEIEVAGDGSFEVRR